LVALPVVIDAIDLLSVVAPIVIYPMVRDQNSQPVGGAHLTPTPEGCLHPFKVVTGDMNIPDTTLLAVGFKNVGIHMTRA
jgi:hypothetical protein